MFSPCKSKGVLALAVLAAAVVGAVHAHRAAAAPSLVYCIDSASPSAPVDAAVARAASRAIGYSARIEHFDSAKYGDDGAPAHLFTRLARRCDLVMGFPVEAGDPHVPAGLQATQGYMHTGFMLVAQGRRPTAFARLPAGTQVGVTYLTVSNTYFAHRPGLTPTVYNTDDDNLQALLHHQVNAAIVWQLSLRAFEATHEHTGLRERALHMPHARWELVALYRAGGDGPRAARLFERGVHKLSANGALKRSIRPDARWVSANETRRPSGDGGHASGPPALYTPDEARAGAKVYADNCAQCHGDKLQGVVGPTLKGKGFADKSMNYTVGDIFSFLAQQMPAGAPGSLSHRQYAEVMAHILHENGYPAGHQSLGYEAAEHSKVPLVSRIDDH